jgi:hypothetical protein
MKEYKGLYHNSQDKTNTYEYGAHFKYAELYIALKNLQIKQKKENPISEENNDFLLENENKEEVVQEKKRKKYKLRTFNLNENNRYLLTDVNKINNEKNEFSIIEEEEDNIKNQIRNKNRFMTKSLDKIRLPKISSNNLNSLQDNHFQTEENESPRLYLSYERHHKKKKTNFPKLNIIFQENMNNNNNIETQSIFEDKGAIKIYNEPYEESSKRTRIHKKKKDRMFPKLFQLSKNNEEKSEIMIKPHRRNDKLKSIFEKEKFIRNNNNLFLGEKNGYFRTEERDMKIDQMAKQIHNLKKKLFDYQN